MLNGHKAEWNIYKQNGEHFIILDCLYDSTDFLSEIASSWEVDYINKTITITRGLAE